MIGESFEGQGPLTLWQKYVLLYSLTSFGVLTQLPTLSYAYRPGWTFFFLPLVPLLYGWGALLTTALLGRLDGFMYPAMSRIVAVSYVLFWIASLAIATVSVFLSAF